MRKQRQERMDRKDCWEVCDKMLECCIIYESRYLDLVVELLRLLVTVGGNLVIFSTDSSSLFMRMKSASSTSKIRQRAVNSPKE